MTEPKRYYGTAVVSRQSIEMSNDMALVKTEQHLLVELYMEADMPRDFRIQFRYEPLEVMDSIKCVGMLTVIDPTNPRIEEDKDWFKWIKQAPTRNVVITNTNTTANSSMHLLEKIYEPVMKAQLEQAKDLKARLDAVMERDRRERLHAIDLDGPFEDGPFE